MLKIDKWDGITNITTNNSIALVRTRKEQKIKRKQRIVTVQENPMEESMKRVLAVNKAKDLLKQRTNLKAILKYSNASPIRAQKDTGYQCCFCDKQFTVPADLKQHTIETHDSSALSSALRDTKFYPVKLDITDLLCKHCDEHFYNVEPLLDHLADRHEETVYREIKSFIMPLKFETNSIQCFMCSCKFIKFKGLLEHMNTHYRNYICDVCDVGFMTPDMLRNHSKHHETGSYVCSYCSKVFITRVKMQAHERLVHVYSNMMNRCRICDERFSSHYRKMIHLSEAHGVAPALVKCQACEQTFTTTGSLKAHIDRYHLLKKSHFCPQCNLGFYRMYEMNKHVLTHTGLKPYECDICHKAYARKSTLRKHAKKHE